MSTIKNESPKTAAAILVEAAVASKTGNAPSMDALTAALAAADAASAAGKRTAKPVALTGNALALFAKDGPFATGTATDGHRRFIKGLIPRLVDADRATLTAMVKHYGVKL